MDAVSVPLDLLRGPAAPSTPRGSTPEQIRRTAEDFEASFLSALLAPMFAGLSTEAPFGGGSGEQAFRGFMVEAMAKQATKARGVGLADHVERELLRLQGLS